MSARRIPTRRATITSKRRSSQLAVRVLRDVRLAVFVGVTTTRTPERATALLIASRDSAGVSLGRLFVTTMILPRLSYRVHASQQLREAASRQVRRRPPRPALAPAPSP